MLRGIARKLFYGSLSGDFRTKIPDISGYVSVFCSKIPKMEQIQHCIAMASFHVERKSVIPTYNDRPI